MRHQPQLHLRVVGADEEIAGLGIVGGKGLADLPPLLVPHRDILQIGVARGEPTGRCLRLVVSGVDPSSLGVDHRGKGDQVGAKQLGETAVVEDQPDDGVQVADLLQLLLSGGVLTGSGLLRLRQQLQVIEEELSHLLGGVDIDRIPVHRVVDLLLQSLQRLLHLADSLAEEGLIDTHPRLLHLQQHAHQRHLDVVEE